MGLGYCCYGQTRIASTSTMRLQLFRELFTTTRTCCTPAPVVPGSTANTRIALSLPVTFPPGMVTQPVLLLTLHEPLQTCTMKSRIPSPVAGEFTSGSPAVVQLFCNV